MDAAAFFWTTCFSALVAACSRSPSGDSVVHVGPGEEVPPLTLTLNPSSGSTEDPTGNNGANTPRGTDDDNKLPEVSLVKASENQDEGKVYFTLHFSNKFENVDVSDFGTNIGVLRNIVSALGDDSRQTATLEVAVAENLNDIEALLSLSETAEFVNSDGEKLVFGMDLSALPSADPALIIDNVGLESGAAFSATASRTRLVVPGSVVDGDGMLVSDEANKSVITFSFDDVVDLSSLTAEDFNIQTDLYDVVLAQGETPKTVVLTLTAQAAIEQTSWTLLFASDASFQDDAGNDSDSGFPGTEIAVLEVDTASPYKLQDLDDISIYGKDPGARLAELRLADYFEDGSGSFSFDVTTSEHAQGGAIDLVTLSSGMLSNSDSVQVSQSGVLTILLKDDLNTLALDDTTIREDITITVRDAFGNTVQEVFSVVVSAVYQVSESTAFLDNRLHALFTVTATEGLTGLDLTDFEVSTGNGVVVGLDPGDPTDPAGTSFTVTVLPNEGLAGETLRLDFSSAASFFNADGIEPQAILEKNSVSVYNLIQHEATFSFNRNETPSVLHLTEAFPATTLTLIFGETVDLSTLDPNDDFLFLDANYQTIDLASAPFRVILDTSGSGDRVVLSVVGEADQDFQHFSLRFAQDSSFDSAGGVDLAATRQGQVLANYILDTKPPEVLDDIGDHHVPSPAGGTSERLLPVFDLSDYFADATSLTYSLTQDGSSVGAVEGLLRDGFLAIHGAGRQGFGADIFTLEAYDAVRNRTAQIFTISAVESVVSDVSVNKTSGRFLEFELTLLYDTREIEAEDFESTHGAVLGVHAAEGMAGETITVTVEYPELLDDEYVSLRAAEDALWHLRSIDARVVLPLNEYKVDEVAPELELVENGADIVLTSNAREHELTLFFSDTIVTRGGRSSERLEDRDLGVFKDGTLVDSVVALVAENEASRDSVKVVLQANNAVPYEELTLAWRDSVGFTDDDGNAFVLEPSRQDLVTFTVDTQPPSLKEGEKSRADFGSIFALGRGATIGQRNPSLFFDAHGQALTVSWSEQTPTGEANNIFDVYQDAAHGVFTFISSGNEGTELFTVTLFDDLGNATIEEFSFRNIKVLFEIDEDNYYTRDIPNNFIEFTLTLREEVEGLSQSHFEAANGTVVGLTAAASINPKGAMVTVTVALDSGLEEVPVSLVAAEGRTVQVGVYDVALALDALDHGVIIDNKSPDLVSWRFLTNPAVLRPLDDTAEIELVFDDALHASADPLLRLDPADFSAYSAAGSGLTTEFFQVSLPDYGVGQTTFIISVMPVDGLDFETYTIGFNTDRHIRDHAGNQFDPSDVILTSFVIDTAGPSVKEGKALPDFISSSSLVGMGGELAMLDLAAYFEDAGGINRYDLSQDIDDTTNPDDIFRVHNANGHLTFYAVNGMKGLETLTVTAVDTYENKSVHEITIGNNQNSPPVHASVAPGGTLTVIATGTDPAFEIMSAMLLAGITDSDGDPLTVSIDQFGQVLLPPRSTGVVNVSDYAASDDGLTHTFTGARAGAETYSMTVSDGRGGMSVWDLEVIFHGVYQKENIRSTLQVFEFADGFDFAIAPSDPDDPDDMPALGFSRYFGHTDPSADLTYSLEVLTPTGAATDDFIISDDGEITARQLFIPDDAKFELNVTATGPGTTSLNQPLTVSTILSVVKRGFILDQPIKLLTGIVNLSAMPEVNLAMYRTLLDADDFNFSVRIEGETDSLPDAALSGDVLRVWELYPTVPRSHAFGSLTLEVQADFKHDAGDQIDATSTITVFQTESRVKVNVRRLSSGLQTLFEEDGTMGYTARADYITGLGDVNHDGFDDFAIANTAMIKAYYGMSYTGEANAWDTPFQNLNVMAPAYGPTVEGGGNVGHIGMQQSTSQNDDLDFFYVKDSSGNGVGAVIGALNEDLTGEQFNFGSDNSYGKQHQLGASFRILGDINGDGFDDFGFILDADVNNASHGRIGILYGSAALDPRLEAFVDSATPRNHRYFFSGPPLAIRGSHGIQEWQYDRGYPIRKHDGFQFLVQENYGNRNIAERGDKGGFGETGGIHALGDINGDGLADFAIALPEREVFRVGNVDWQKGGQILVVFGVDRNTVRYNADGIGRDEAAGLGEPKQFTRPSGSGYTPTLVDYHELSRVDFRDTLETSNRGYAYSHNIVYDHPEDVSGDQRGDRGNPVVMGFTIDAHRANSITPGVRGHTYLGYDVSGIGDYNGDGIDDFAFSVLGQQSVYVYLGHDRGDYYRINAARKDLDPEGHIDFRNFEKYLFEIRSSQANFGKAVEGIGDFNGDGIEDFAIGSPQERGVYVVLGRPLDLNLLRGDRSDILAYDDILFIYDGAVAAGEFGGVIEKLGDINGDGFDDIALGYSGGLGRSVRVIFGDHNYGQSVHGLSSPELPPGAMPSFFQGTNVAETEEVGSYSLVRSSGGDDILNDVGTKSVARAGEGDDEIHLTNRQTAKFIDGGFGIDTLYLNESTGVLIDLVYRAGTASKSLTQIEAINPADYDENNLKNIEKFVFGTGDQTLVLDYDRVQELVGRDVTQRFKVTLGDGTESQLFRGKFVTVLNASATGSDLFLLGGVGPSALTLETIKFTRLAARSI